MSSWKEKIGDGLTGLVAGSPPAVSSASHPARVRDPPVALDEVPKILPFSADGLHSPKSSTVSLPSSFLQKTSSVFDRVKMDIPRRWTGLRPTPSWSLPVKWRSNNSTSKERTMHGSVGVEERNTVDFTDGTERKEVVEISEESEEHVSGRKIDCDILVGRTVMSNTSKDFLSNLMDESTFISSDLFEFLQSSLPNIVKGRKWVLLYSTLKHGISFRTLIRKSAGLPGPCLLIVGDKQGAIFGGLLDCPLKPTAKGKYQGTNQTFLFTTIYGAPRLFRATGANRFYYLCLNDLLAFGGGGSFALCLDEDLLHGTSGPCDTFGNLCLAHSPEFELKNVELWGFAHISRYLNSG